MTGLRQLLKKAPERDRPLDTQSLAGTCWNVLPNLPRFFADPIVIERDGATVLQWLSPGHAC
jgi:hypothetical protein